MVIVHVSILAALTFMALLSLVLSYLADVNPRMSSDDRKGWAVGILITFVPFMVFVVFLIAWYWS
jgi:hypothetical protein